MSTNVLKFADIQEDEPIFPLEVYGAHKAIIGQAGSGKTVTAKKYVEQLLSRPRRVVIIDPTGAWWGMRLMQDGVTPSPYPILIMGGDHGDRKLEPSMGALFGQIVARTQICMIFDLSLMTQEEQHQFTGPFIEAIHEENRRGLHLIIDEADEFVPQKNVPKVCSEPLRRMLQRGRVKKIAVTLITQRIQVIDKTALAQAKAAVIMGFSASRDRAMVMSMVETFPSPSLVTAFEKSLASLKTGEGWVWCQPYDVLKRRSFPFIDTYNSSPSFTYEDEFADDTHAVTVLPSLNLAELDEMLATCMLPPEDVAESEEVQLLRASHAKLVDQIEAMEERERQLILDGQASADMALDCNERSDIDQMMLHLAIGHAAAGAALNVQDLIAKTGVEIRPLAHRSILRLVLQGKVTIRDGLVWPTAEMLRRAETTDGDFACSIDIDLSGLVFAKPILTKAETAVSTKLAGAARRLKLNCLPQVAMGAFIETVPGIDPELTARARHAFAGRNVDFVLCDDHCEVKAIIELDDTTHNRVTDAMRDAVAAAAGIPTLRLLHAKGVTIELLETSLRQLMDGESPSLNHPCLRSTALAA